MGYTTFNEKMVPKPDNFEKLKIRLILCGRDSPIYVLSIPKQEHKEEHIRERCKDIGEIIELIHVNGTYNFIVKGEETKAKNIGHKIYQKTGMNVGCVRYQGEDMMNFYVTLKEAIDIATQRGKGIHVYDHSKDSISALVNKALKN